MLKDSQIEEIAEAWHDIYGCGHWYDLDPIKQDHIKDGLSFAIDKAIAIQSEQDRRSFIAIGKHIGVQFASDTDIVSEVYKKLDEILGAFREHSQEIAISKQTRALINLLERYDQQKDIVIDL